MNEFIRSNVERKLSLKNDPLKNEGWTLIRESDSKLAAGQWAGGDGWRHKFRHTGVDLVDGGTAMTACHPLPRQLSAYAERADILAHTWNTVNSNKHVVNRHIIRAPPPTKLRYRGGGI